MCGICGVVQIGGDPRQVVPTEVLNRMTDTMTHRGPNDSVRPGVALAERARGPLAELDGGAALRAGLRPR